MNNILVFGDIHGRNIWKQVVESEKGNFRYVLFLGDYVSTHEDISSEMQMLNLQEIMAFKESDPDHVIMLRGNHDLQHLGYYWARCSGLDSKVLKWMSQDSVKERFLNNTQWVYETHPFLFSHAGVSKVWFENIKNLSEIKLEEFSDINKLPPSELFAFWPRKMNDRYGTSDTQPCTWIRPHALSECAVDNRTQIVGHTTMSQLTVFETDNFNTVYLCDCLPRQYCLVNLEDNRVEIKDI